MAEWQSAMTPAEFQGWVEFYMGQPFDDLHRIHRPHALVAASLGGKLEEKLEWLAPQQGTDEYSPADLSTMKAFGFKPSDIE